MFGLPGGVSACLFDMDGVVTKTAVVDAAAWKEMFDEFLREHAESTGTEFVPFDAHAGHDAYVDGKPAAQDLRAPRERAAVFEDVQAGVAADFALVVGVDRVGQAEELREHGADIVVKDLADLLEEDGQPDKGAR